MCTVPAVLRRAAMTEHAGAVQTNHRIYCNRNDGQMPPSSCEQSARKGTVNKASKATPMASGPSSDIQHQQSSAKAARSINCM